MEPLSDKELNDLLAEWSPLPAPETLETGIFGKRKQIRWGAWLLSGIISMPVPLLLVLVILFCLLGFEITNRHAQKTERQVTFADFRPVKQLQPRIIRSNYEEN